MVYGTNMFGQTKSNKWLISIP